MKTSQVLIKSLKTEKVTNSKTLRVFETFSGIGAQSKALSLIKKFLNYNYKIVATSEWDVYAVIAYAEIHNLNKSHKFNDEIWSKFIRENTLSLDGKTPANLKTLEKLNYNFKKKIYESFLNTRNLGSIINII